jgi:hypothetical protein
LQAVTFQSAQRDRQHPLADAVNFTAQLAEAEHSRAAEDVNLGGARA